ncbi:uncharacterized protein Dwil_GK21384 [Drosophila willistoni]|uniref:GK21384 n=1 Tax=Drosophila willistoni TaxID=7260 RepID=B4MQR9_DROWI|nr:uncharacterized protein LOC6640387 [Drosophila willistoni]EDW74458.1 uncharacterized protein Dwil_GK21384 [Drosophila willistoni]
MDFIDDFIEEYKCNPCLWKADSADFRNRMRRQEAYMKLIDVATKHGELYNVERTKQKINNLRCAFRHQLRKYNEVKKKGEKYEPYCPKRRYFESLMFLKDEEIPDKKSKREDNPLPVQHNSYTESTVTMVQSENCEEFSDAESLPKPCKAMDNNKLSPSNSANEFCANLFDESAVDPIISIQTVTTNNNNNHPSGGATIKEVEIVMTSDNGNVTERRKSIPEPATSNKSKINTSSTTQILCVDRDKRPVPHNQIKVNRKRSSSVSSQVSDENDVPVGKFRTDISTIDFERLLSLALKSADSHIDDHFANFGKIIAHKLRSMEATQAIYAEKIIGDVLYQGQLKMLSTLSTHQFLGVDNATVYVENHTK